MSNFRYNTPDNFKEYKERWFKYFTIPSFVTTIIFSVVSGVIFIPVFNALGLIFAGILLTIIWGGIGYSISTFNIPLESKFPWAGLKPITIIFRIILRRLPRNKKIYVKHYGEYENFYEEGRK